MSKKRLSEIMDLEIINIHNGEKYGFLGDCELEFNVSTGEITNLIVSEGSNSIFSFKETNQCEIPWETKIKQGDKTIIFDYRD